MRQVSETEYETAKAALASYNEYCKPYVQRNGWTVIPKEAPRAFFEGKELTSDAVNAHSTNVELFEMQRDKPERFTTYVTPEGVTTWTVERIGRVVARGDKHVNNLGGAWRAITIKTDWGFSYHGREYDSRQCVNFKRAKVSA
jgi:hypothetical protein